MSNPLAGVKALFFDIFGTTVRWDEHIVLALEAAAGGQPTPAPFANWNEVARRWRDGHFAV